MTPREPLAPFACHVCYMPGVLYLRFNKKNGLPDTSCCACGARMFCKSMNAMLGVFRTGAARRGIHPAIRAQLRCAAQLDRDAEADVRALREHIELIAAPRVASETGREEAGYGSGTSEAPKTVPAPAAAS